MGTWFGAILTRSTARVLSHRQGATAMLCSINISHAGLAFTLLVLLGQPICLALPASHQVEAPDADVKVLVDDLSTARRGTAKARLLEIGIRASPQLIARLPDLTELEEDP